MCRAIDLLPKVSSNCVSSNRNSSSSPPLKSSCQCQNQCQYRKVFECNRPNKAVGNYYLNSKKIDFWLNIVASHLSYFQFDRFFVKSLMQSGSCLKVFCVFVEFSWFFCTCKVGHVEDQIFASNVNWHNFIPTWFISVTMFMNNEMNSTSSNYWMYFAKFLSCSGLHNVKYLNLSFK